MIKHLKNTLIPFFFITQQVYAFPAWEVNITANLDYAHIKGMAQTPRGGSPNTTDTNRPQLSEGGIHDELYYDVGAGFGIYHFFMNFIYHHLQPDGHDTLKSNLLTHNQLIPSGQDFNLSFDFDWYQLQMGNYFKVIKHLQLSPIVEGHWIHYHYQFASYPFASARSFSMAATNLGLGLRLNLNEWLLAELQATTSLPFSNLDINRLNLVLNTEYKLQPHLVIRPQISLGIFRIDYEDYQLITNHIRYTATPNIALGFTLAVI
ncbi:MAG: hypothetical protein AB7I18_06605 [Candidatus Berkiella sp.]